MSSMNRQLSYAASLERVVNATIAGTTNINGSSVDMLGFEGVTFVALLGTLTATQVTSLKAQHSDDNATWTDIANTNTGPAADADSNKSLVLDIYKPRKRYVRPVVVRGTANAVVDGVLAIKRIPYRQPVSQGATVSASKVLDNPADGAP